MLSKLYNRPKKLRKRRKRPLILTRLWSWILSKGEKRHISRMRLTSLKQKRKPLRHSSNLSLRRLKRIAKEKSPAKSTKSTLRLLSERQLNQRWSIEMDRWQSGYHGEDSLRDKAHKMLGIEQKGA